MFGFINGAISVPHSFDNCNFPALSFLIYTFLAESEVFIDHWFFIDKYLLLPSVGSLYLFNRLHQVQIH